MLFCITRQYSTSLIRGVAVLAIGSLAAGCSSGVAGLTDGLTTSSTGNSMVAQASQPYPGDRIPRPREPVGFEVQNSATASPSAPDYTYSQPVYDAPALGSSDVSSAPLAAPTGMQNQQRSALAPVNTPEPVTAAAPPPVQAPQPAQQPTQVASLPQAPKAPQSGSGSISRGTYTVAAGDTLYAISRKSGASVEQLQQANGLTDGSIRIGQKLTIPGGTAIAAAAPAKAPQPIKTAASPTPTATPVVKKPDAPKVTAQTPPAQPEKTAEKVEEAASDEQVAALTPQSTGVDRLRWPVRGRVVTNFGASSGGRTNDGIDIVVPEGTAVHAAENGVVIYAGDGLKGFGNTVLVRHEDGLVTVYGHTSQMKVKRGDNVRRGQEIALSGMTGDADQPKLHFEVRKGTNPVDPNTYLE